MMPRMLKVRTTDGSFHAGARKTKTEVQNPMGAKYLTALREDKASMLFCGLGLLHHLSSKALSMKYCSVSAAIPINGESGSKGA
mmetsp:Transcript_70653/g.154062  ORF Transcript_70653/g.154062 Transcript_70653/m.154062 type:complete len:84 (+) Transcript_70653:885-1136(+)